MKKRWIAAGIAGAAVITVYLMNASWLAPAPKGQPILLAHRGVYQRYNRTGLTLDTCTASRILPPTNPYLENTLPSMKASLDAGADQVEVDVHPTTDGQFAVFHDWTVDCRTDGHGVTRDHTMAELKALDIGYGYTADGGRTFPFRGRFKGQMPSLKEALAAFPDTRFLINIKSNDPTEADRLVAYLNVNKLMSPRVTVYGGDRPMQRFAQIAPNLKPFGKSSIKACGIPYIALGWTGYMPRACHDTVLFLPQNWTWMAWGYPNRLQDRFARAGTIIYLIGPVQNANGIAGIDTPAQLSKVPDSWRMGILTDDIKAVGPALKARESK